jgi:hypothetical protein
MQAFKIHGYAALPLVGGLIAQGMAPGAAMAVWVLARPQVFTLDITALLSATFLAGLVYQ